MYSDAEKSKTGGADRMDVALEAVWLLLIFALPLYFNPFGQQAFYFAKALLLQFMVCLMLGLYLARWFLAGRDGGTFNLLSAVKRSPLQAAVIAFGLLWAVSTVFSIMPESSFWGSLSRKNGLASILAWIVFFLILAHCVRRRAQLYRALVVLTVSTGMVSLFGILELADPWLFSRYSINGRVFATDGNPLSLSGFISMALPVNLALVMMTWYGPDRGRKRALKIAVLLLAFALQMACLCLAQYSITILLFIPGIFIFFLLAGICLKRKATVIMSAGVLALLLLLALIIVGQTLMPMTADTAVTPAAPDTYVSTASPGTSVAVQAGLNTVGLRVSQWTCALNVVLDSPAVPLHANSLQFLRRWIGYGPEMMVVASQMRYPPEMKSADTSNSQLLGQPENHYLYLAVTIGLLGLAAFLAMVLIFFYMGLRLLRKSREKDVIYIGAALVAGIAQYCVHILFNPTAILPEFVFWLLLALMAAMVKMEMTGGAGPVITGSTQKAGAGKLRKAVAVLMVVVFVGVGFSLTFKPALADMKLRSALNSWNMDADMTLSALAEAANLQSREAVYYGYIGAYAFKLADITDNATEKSKFMTLSTAVYEVACKRDPYLAYWSYKTADAFTYMAAHGEPSKWPVALRYYERADILMSEDAVILNNWALALMLSGDYAEAGRKLSQSREADPGWVQTSLYMGLLDVYAPGYRTEGNSFVYPVEQKPGNAGPFISFCKQLALYGGLDKAIEGLKAYIALHPGNWTGWELLGIAEVYGNRLSDAAESFRNAAANVPSGDAAMLKGIVTLMGAENPGFKPMAQEIAGSLAAKVPGSVK